MWGLIAEGKEDLAVIKNIIAGRGYDIIKEIKSIKPNLQSDATDLSRGTFEGVKNECTHPDLILLEKSQNPDLKFVIHLDIEPHFTQHRSIDTDEPAYSMNTVESAIKEIISWLNTSGRLNLDFLSCIYYAIPVEEMEAWVMTLYPKKSKKGITDTSKVKAPKYYVQTTLIPKYVKKSSDKSDPFMSFYCLTEPFQKKKILSEAMKYSTSLRLFVETIPAK